MSVGGRERGGEWVLLSYRMPREPSTPRIAVWRKLKRLGVAQLGDGLVALPADARTREQLEWVAEDVEQAGGSAMLWTARPDSVGQERRIASEMAAARAQEYLHLCEEAHEAAGIEPGTPTTSSIATAPPPGVLRRLRAELRRIERRDYFPPPERETARAAVRRLADLVDAPATAGEPV